MNWFQKTAQILSANFTLETAKIGTVFIEIQCSFEDYNDWYQYKTGSQGWNDSQIRDTDAINRSIEVEPNVRIHISHMFSDSMPRIDRPRRTIEDKSEMGTFDIIGDQMLNLENDDFYETVKIKDVGETIRSWMFKPIQGVRRVNPKDSNIQFELHTGIVNALEELQQQYWRFI